jgi:hypothetical protein
MFREHSSSSDKGSLGFTAPAREPFDESALILAALQVKINVLRRAQTMAPQMADELQAVIDEIQQDLRALEPCQVARFGSKADIREGVQLGV